MARVARTYDTLMRRLGYESYGTHGSDGGAMVSRELAVLDPPGFLGAHVLQLFSFPSGDPSEFDAFGPKEYAALEFLGWFQSVGGYNQMNGTRPQTIAAALSDSPVGQLAYNELFENFGNGTSLVTAGAGAHPGLALLADQHLRHRGALPLRGGHSGAEPVVSQGRIGVAVFAARLPDHPAARRARQRQHRALVGVRPRRPLRRARGARPGRGDLRTFFAG